MVDDMRLPYVTRDADRHGNVRLYVRKRGVAGKVRLREAPGTPRFMAEYAAAIDHLGIVAGSIVPQAARVAEGSLRHLSNRYRASPEFGDLEDSTKAVRRRLLERLCAHEVNGTEAGDLPWQKMQRRHVRLIRDGFRENDEDANGILKALRQMLAWGIDVGDLDVVNPASLVPYFASAGRGRHSWSIAEARQYEARHPLGTTARLCYDMALYTLQRLSDVAVLGPRHEEEPGWWHFTQYKNRNRHPVDLWLPIHPALQQSISLTPTGADTYLITAFGEPFSTKGLGNKVRQWCDEAGLPQCSLHGLRKGGAAILAEHGSSDEFLQSVGGWTTKKEVSRYTKAARQRIMAGQAVPLIGLDRVPPVGHKGG